MDSHYLKLSGKAELPKAIEISSNFRVLMEGSIISEEIIDNDDGTKSHAYRFKPVLVEGITKTGERIKTKDTRSRSQQFRMVLMKEWREANEPIDFETYYDREMVKIINGRINN